MGTDRAQARIDPYRPAPPDNSFARRLRALAGVREEILDWVPEERPRYTRLGAVVLVAGCLAGLSMLAALVKVWSLPWPLLLPIAAFWGWVIATIDGWLVASTHGTGSRLRAFVPRLVLSVVIGIVIAEPLVLRVFQPAIHQQVRETRATEVIAYESLLKTCNRPDGAQADQDKCADHLLSVAGAPEGQWEKLRQARRERGWLAASIERDRKEARRLGSLARAECGGSRGAEFSGIPGVGPNCRDNRTQRDAFIATSRLPEREKQLAALDRTIESLTQQLGSDTQVYGQQLTAAIEKKVDERRRAQEQIGLLEEHDALGTLSSQSILVFAAPWFLRALLILVDCLPVLIKRLGGTTYYDHLVTRQLDTALNLHEITDGLRHESGTIDNVIRTKQLKHEREARLKEIERFHEVREQAELDDDIDDLARRLGWQRPVA
ncbi:DUF4407 domain-containing protein [Actinomadura fulvescens]|uniref:DUF4407 domain-containing protein n=1 Tax=Actinomadura fulvescens TaxID=46160 RepID=A0ABN3Q9U9_9ACTN